MTPVAITAGTKAFISSFVLSNVGIGETIRRTLGHLSVRSDQVVATEDFRGAIGFIVANDLALGVGASALPGPVTDASDDGWFVWIPFSGSQGADPSISFGSFPWDSKAMRRVEEGFGIGVMAECTGVGCLVSLQTSLYGTRN